ncbi:hypothetical protein ABIE21_002012 [Conyzicola nivalis]|uniref:NERD domain-containing protein n=1 Tax=Conyzicola nivalis TaxID=1477021 RepID=A0ABV2QNE8_9MICO
MTGDTGTRTDFAGIQALSSRAAGYSVAAKCLEVQAAAEARDPSLRTDTGVTLHDDAWSWYQGALGEMHVGNLLKALGPEWFVRHAVPIGAGTKDVDHLVIGPGGVFSINTKHHAGASIWVGDFALRVNNVAIPHVSQSKSDGADVARRLTSKVGFPVTVTPTLAFLNPKSISDDSSNGNRVAAAVDAKRLVGWLTARPRVLSETELALITIAAEEPNTWHIDPRAADTLRVMQRFERLVAQVGRPPAPKNASPRSSGARSTSRARPSRPRTAPRNRRPVPRKVGERASVLDLLKVWAGIGLLLAVLLVFREIANQPCTSPMSCFVPMFYIGLKPFMMLGALALVGLGTIGTLVWIVRRATR